MIIRNLGFLGRKASNPWVFVDPPDSKTWYDVAFGNNVFVAVALSGGGDRAMRSTNNGQSWTQTTIQLEAWHGIEYGNSSFIAVSPSNASVSTNDGVTWSDLPNYPGGAGAGTKIAFGNNTFVVCGNTNSVQVTTDEGSTWNSYSIVSADHNDVAYGGGNFVTVNANDATSKAYYSTDNGQTWTAATGTTSTALFSVTYDGSNFYAIGFDEVFKSTDGGVTWSLVGTTTGSNNFVIGYTNNELVAFSSSGGPDGETSTNDGSTWSLANFPQKLGNRGIAYGSSTAIIVGSDSVLYKEY